MFQFKRIIRLAAMFLAFFAAVAFIDLLLFRFGAWNTSGVAQENGTSDGLLKKAEKLAEERKRVGSELVNIAGDDKESKTRRIKAARLLGELQFPGGVEVLIRSIDLQDPSFRGLSGSIGLHQIHPFISAVAAYRDAAVPQVIHAYLTERNQQRRYLLFHAIQHGKTTDVAIRHLRGAKQPDETDWLRKQNAQELETLLTEK